MVCIPTSEVYQESTPVMTSQVTRSPAEDQMMPLIKQIETNKSKLIICITFAGKSHETE